MALHYIIFSNLINGNSIFSKLKNKTDKKNLSKKKINTKLIHKTIIIYINFYYILLVLRYANTRFKLHSPRHMFT